MSAATARAASAVADDDVDVHGARDPTMDPRLHTLLLVFIFHALYVVGPALCLGAPVYLAWTGRLGPALALPLAWAATWDGSQRRLGKPWPALARSRLWTFVFRWFPITLETPRGLALDPARTYVLAAHPHGAMAFNRAAFGFDVDHLWNAAFPGVRFRVLTATAAFYVPVIREVWLWTYCVDASRETARRNLAAGHSLLVYPGGEREQILTRRGAHVLYLMKRRGFVRLALEMGADLVPVYAFGDTDLYDHSAFALGLRKWLVHKCGVAVPLISGSIGILPHRTPIRIVVGEPIPHGCADGCPTPDQVDAAHAAYVAALRALFDKHKARCGYPDAELVIT